MYDVSIRRKQGGVIHAWVDDTAQELYIRESLDRGRDVQTVCLSAKELDAIVNRLRPHLKTGLEVSENEETRG